MLRIGNHFNNIYKAKNSMKSFISWNWIKILFFQLEIQIFARIFLDFRVSFYSQTTHKMKLLTVLSWISLTLQTQHECMLINERKYEKILRFCFSLNISGFYIIFFLKNCKDSTRTCFTAEFMNFEFSWRMLLCVVSYFNEKVTYKKHNKEWENLRFS